MTLKRNKNTQYTQNTQNTQNTHKKQVIAWLWSPIIFNPNGVEWLDVIKDFDGWLSWMTAGDDDPDKSWHAWWIQQNSVSTVRAINLGTAHFAARGSCSCFT